MKFEKLTDLINSLENQVENLTLYLSYVRVNAPGFWSVMEEHFDGMGGYAEQDVSKMKAMIRRFEERG